MYLPAHFQQDDPALLLEVMRAYSFATLVNHEDGKVVANAIPLLAEQGTQGIQLHGHCAYQNPFAKLPELSEVLAIFHGPHAYVSPLNYSRMPSVPTWNYVAVHAYGRIRWVEDVAHTEATMQRLVAHYDVDYLPQYMSLPDEYKNKMFAAIRAFVIEVTQIEGKFKLNQNKTAADRLGVYAAQREGSPDEQALAVWMERLGLVD